MTTTTITAPTTAREADWKLAIKVIRANGIKVRQNVQACCPGCITSEQLRMTSPDQPVIYTYGGQGAAYAWEDGVCYTRKSVRAWSGVEIQSLWFNHTNLTDEQANWVVSVFRAHGFEAEWDGSHSTCIEVHPNRQPVSLDIPCAECNAEVGEDCRPFCTAASSAL